MFFEPMRGFLQACVLAGAHGGTGNTSGAFAILVATRGNPRSSPLATSPITRKSPLN